MDSNTNPIQCPMHGNEPEPGACQICFQAGMYEQRRGTAPGADQGLSSRSRPIHCPMHEGEPQPGACQICFQAGVDEQQRRGTAPDADQGLTSQPDPNPHPNPHPNPNLVAWRAVGLQPRAISTAFGNPYATAGQWPGRGRGRGRERGRESSRSEPGSSMPQRPSLLQGPTSNPYLNLTTNPSAVPWRAQALPPQPRATTAFGSYSYGTPGAGSGSASGSSNTHLSVPQRPDAYQGLASYPNLNLNAGPSSTPNTNPTVRGALSNSAPEPSAAFRSSQLASAGYRGRQSVREGSSVRGGSSSSRSQSGPPGGMLPLPGATNVRVMVIEPNSAVNFDGREYPERFALDPEEQEDYEADDESERKLHSRRNCQPLPNK